MTVGGKAAAVPESIREAQQMLDRTEAFARRTAAEKYLEVILSAIDEARAKLEALSG